MGNFQKEAIAKVEVILDTIIFLPGENITGRINIFPKDKRHSHKLSNPQITFSILQQQNWQCFIFSENQNSSSNGEKEVNCFCERTKNFSEYKDRNISEGLQIPFLYIIPEDITPSLEWPLKKFEFAYIRNFFCVKIPELNYEKQILIIIQKPPNKLQSPLLVKAEEDRKKYLIFGGGRIKVEGSYPTSSYPALGTIPVTVSVDASQSDVKIKNVTVKLKRKLEFYYKNSEDAKKKYLQLMYYETKKVNEIKEKIIFNIPFKDGNDIEYENSTTLGDKVNEICCLLPNVETDTIKVSYYIKIIAVLDGLLVKNIKLKMTVDFHSKDEKKKNENAFDFFSERVTLINCGDIKLNNDDPYLNYNNNTNLNDLNNNCVFISGNGIYKNKDILNNNINNNINNNATSNFNNFINNENNMINDPYNINLINNNMNINNNNLMNNNLGNIQRNLPHPPVEDDLELPSLSEVLKGEEYYKNKKLEYPQI